MMKQSITTRTTSGLILNLKGFVVFTAESQRTLRKMFFSFPLRGRKAKILNPDGYDEFPRYLPMMLVQHSNAECFSFAVLSTAKEKYSHSASFASLANLPKADKAGGEIHTSNNAPTRIA